MHPPLAALTDNPALFLANWPVTPQVHHGNPGTFAALLDAADIRRLLGNSAHRPPEVGMVRDGILTGEPPDPDHETDTLALNGLHKTWLPLVEFSTTLAALLGHSVTANAYRTPPGSRGYGCHWDTHAVFLAQVHGVKEWRVWRPVVADPLERHRWTFVGFTDADRKRIAGPADFTVALRAGDVLHIPRGWVHEGRTTNAADSLHITIGVHQQTWHSLICRLADLAAEDLLMRGPLPPNLGCADTSTLLTLARNTFGSWLGTVDPARITELTRLPDRR